MLEPRLCGSKCYDGLLGRKGPGHHADCEVFLLEEFRRAVKILETLP